MKKIYKRFPIKLWESSCDECCMFCDYIEDCVDGCVNQDITCNQCKYEGGDSDE